MRSLARLVAGQVLGLAVLAAVAVRWPHTAAQARMGLQSFAFALAGVVLAAAVVVTVLIIRSQREEPYLGP